MTKEEDDMRVWKPRRLRFIVSECPECSDDRQFRNGESVYNQNLGMAYSVDEIVEVLNADYFSDYVFELLQMKIWYCQAKKKEAGDIKNSRGIDYYHNLELELRKLRDEFHNYGSIFKYSDFLEDRFSEGQ